MNKLIQCVFFLCSTLFSVTQTNASTPEKMQTLTHSYQLGDTLLQVTEYRGTRSGGMVYFHPHDSEQVSIQAARNIIARHGGKAFVVENQGKRIVSFSLQGHTYSFDPNRIFSAEGVAATLRRYGPYSDAARDATVQFARWLSGLLSSGRVFAIHNNRDTTYNVLSYRDAKGHPAQGVKALSINSKQDPGNFVYTTNIGLYMAAKDSGFNTVLQAQDVDDDGSYSVYAMRHGLDYINVETKIGDLADDLNLVGFVNRYYNYADLTGETWTTLQKGDLVDLVATSSAYNAAHITYITQVLNDIGLKVRTRYAQQEKGGDPLWYSNKDSERLKQFYEALSAPDSKAVWDIRGGSGTTNFLTSMIGLQPPTIKKPMIGFSDATGAHLFLNSKWNWPTIHGVLAEFSTEVDKKDGVRINDKTSITSVTDLLMGRVRELNYSGLTPLNAAAQNVTELPTTLMGGNLTLLSTAFGTTLQPANRPFTLIVEGIGNNQHQLERMMDQIAYSENMEKIQAVILGEFLKHEAGDSSHDTKLTNLVLQRFADKLEIPVFRWAQFGHGFINRPLPLNTAATIKNNGDGFTLNVQVR